MSHQCHRCQGTGRQRAIMLGDVGPCVACRGSGRVEKSIVKCEPCSGEGYRGPFKIECALCRGTGFVETP